MLSVFERINVPKPDLLSTTPEPDITPLIVLGEIVEALFTNKAPDVERAISVAFKMSAVNDKLANGRVCPIVDTKLTALDPPVRVVTVNP